LSNRERLLERGKQVNTIFLEVQIAMKRGDEKDFATPYLRRDMTCFRYYMISRRGAEKYF
jgi:hypothetical protein